LLHLLAALSLLVPAGAQDPAAPAAGLPQPALSVQPNEGEVGMVMQVKLAVDGEESADCSLIEVPVVPNARLALVSGPQMSQSMGVINGHVTRSMRTEWLFELVPEQPGRLSVGPFRVNCRGAEIRSRTLSVPVRASPFPLDTVTLDVRSNTSELWQGQVFALDVEASLDDGVSDQVVSDGLELDLPWLTDCKGLMRLEVPEPQGDVARVRLAGYTDSLRMRAVRQTVAGKPRIILTRTFLMLAVDPGEVRLPTSRFSARIATETRPTRDPFSLLGGRTNEVVRASTVDARSNGPVLTVRAPPADGRPAAYTNAVGHFKFTGAADPSSLRVGDTCTITLTLTGDGNIDFVKWPEFDELKEDFRIFGKTPRKLPRTQVLDIQVSPKSERVTQVPELAFAFFDPDSGSYQSVSVGPFALSVQPGGSDGLATLESKTDTLSSLVTVREELPPPSSGPPAGWLFVLPSALVLLGVEMAARRRSWRTSHPGLVARRSARRRLDEALAQARDARDLAVAFGKFLSARLDGPPAGMSAEEAAARLADGALSAELREVIGRWEAASFGGAGLDLAAARRQAAQLAARVEAAT
jgi:hypothetical protein